MHEIAAFPLQAVHLNTYAVLNMALGLKDLATGPKDLNV